jgi:hypothetical protein
MFPDAADSLARFSSNEKLPERTLFRSVIDLYELNLRNLTEIHSITTLWKVRNVHLRICIT